MRFLNSVLAILWRNWLKNGDIRKALGICNLNKEIKQHRQDWTNHVERSEHKNKMPKQILVYNSLKKIYLKTKQKISKVRSEQQIIGSNC